MSRIGKKPIPLPKGVTVTIDGRALDVQGPKGKLRQPSPPGIVFEQKGAELVATPESDD
ncbi:MAG: large subunit ribosomal protein, partial [Chloroflexota bacterium]|nr:large subunit ribosomal protein [Chloroflexota bacterium]